MASSDYDWILRERFHTLVLFVGPAVVFFAGLAIVLHPGDVSLGDWWLSSFSGLILCLGAVFASGVMLVRRMVRESKVISAHVHAGHHLFTREEKVSQLGVLFIGFVIAAVLRSVLGDFAQVISTLATVIIGMLYITLTAHYHAHA